ncbi:unnamed protein product [Ectocarpus sp. 12 AP-2014]
MTLLERDMASEANEEGSRKPSRTTRKWRNLNWGPVLIAAAVGCLVERAALVEAQAEETITVTSPTSDDTIYGGESVLVEFTTTGETVVGPYDIDLFKGTNQVAAWCSESAGCDVADGSVLVRISDNEEPGLGYFVEVTDRNSSVSGRSSYFELLEAPSTSSSVVVPEYQDEAGGTGVGDMSLALLVVAGICGIAIIAALLAVCFVTCSRRSAEKMKTAGEAHDLEQGGVLDRTTPGRSNDLNTSEGRGFSMGNPLKGRAASRSTDGGITSYGASPAGTDGPSSQTHPSPGRCIAMGENQRGRSLSRGRSEGPRMYRSSPGQVSATSRSPGEDGAYTPGRSGSFSTPRRTMSHGRDDLRGHQMYDYSVDEGYDGGRGRRSSRSPRAFVSRSRSAGRSRRPPRGDEFDRGERQMSVTPGRGGSSGISPDERFSRSPHVFGMRRSKSEGRADDHSQDLARHKTVEEDVDASRWEHDGMMPSVGTIERGRRSQRLSMTNSRRSKSMHDTSKLGRLDSKGQYDWEDNARSKSATPSRQTYRNGMPDIGQQFPSDVSWEELRSTHLRNKSKVRVRKASSLPPSYGDAMDGGAGRNGSPDDRPPPPSYGPRDANNFTSQLSIGIPDGPSPSSFQSIRSSRSARPGLFGAFGSARRSVTSAGSSGKFGNFGLSPGTRAVSARKAARDAQLSAERALAAAAMASRAADLAAQAALEAEAEADAEMIANDSDQDQEVVMSPRSTSSAGGEVEGSSVREKIKVFSGRSESTGSADKMGRGSPALPRGRSPYAQGLARGWSQADEEEVKARAEQSSANAKEALALMGRSNSSIGKPDNSWVKNEVRGPDTAGGSTDEGGRAVGGDRNLSPAITAPVPAVPSDPEQLAMKRRAFVKQYSQSGTSDYAEDSDYSVFDNATAVTAGKSGTPHGRDKAAAMASGQREQDGKVAEAEMKGTPKRGRPAEDRGRNSERGRAAVKRRSSPGHKTTMEAHAPAGTSAMMANASESGSPRADLP